MAARKRRMSTKKLTGGQSYSNHHTEYRRDSGRRKAREGEKKFDGEVDTVVDLPCRNGANQTKRASAASGQSQTNDRRRRRDRTRSKRGVRVRKYSNACYRKRSRGDGTVGIQVSVRLSKNVRWRRRY